MLQYYINKYCLLPCVYFEAITNFIVILPKGSKHSNDIIDEVRYSKAHDMSNDRMLIIHY